MIFVFVFCCYLIYLLIDWLIRIPRVNGYNNKYVFITGCSTGFGKELAIRLDRMGFHVLAGCYPQDGHKSLTEACSSRLFPVDLDVSSSSSIQAALDTVKEKLPHHSSLWGVVNNAGVNGCEARAEMCTRQHFMEVCQVNLFGAIEVCRMFAPLLRKSKGRFVTVTSTAGRVAAPIVPYTISKFGLEAYCDILRRDMSQFGVKVSIIEPGLFRTPGTDNLERSLGQVESAFDLCSDEVKTAYGLGYVERFRQGKFSHAKRMSDQTDEVVDAYVDALTCRFPKSRYVVGCDAKIIIMMSYLPYWVGDKVIGGNTA